MEGSQPCRGCLGFSRCSPPIMQNKRKEQKRKLLCLQARSGIIPSLLENMNSMISGMQKGKCKTWKLGKSLICLIIECCVQFSSF